MNENNLIPFSQRSQSEARENGAKGGKASGAARRRKKSMRQKLQLLLSLPAMDSDVRELEAIGISPEEMDNEMVILKGLFLKAANGDVSAIREIRSILGKDNAAEELKLRKQELRLKEEAAKNDKPETAEEEALLYRALGADENDV